MTDIIKNPIILPLVLLAIVFVSLGFIQIIFQNGMQTAINDIQTNINSSNRNYEKIVQSQEILNTTIQRDAKLIDQSNQLLNQRTALINTIRNNTGDILTNLQAREHEHDNQTKLLQQGLVQTGNATAQAEAIEKIEGNVQALKRIEQALNITTGKLSNRTGEISSLVGEPIVINP